MIENLQEYCQPAKVEKTKKMFVIEMCEFPIGIINGILSRFRCKGRPYKNKWERDEIIERAMDQIEKDLDVINLVKV